MSSRWWPATLCMCSVLFAPAAFSHFNRATEKEQLTECGKNADRRYSVCRGAWSRKTVALFNTWMAPDTNPESRLDLPSPDGKKVIRVRGFQVRLSVDGKRYWAPFGNMHDAEVGWAPDSKRMFVTWSESGELGPWHTQVYDVAETGLVEIPGVTRRVRADLVSRMKQAPLPNWVSTPARPRSLSGRGALEVSRFSCMLFLSVRGF